MQLNERVVESEKTFNKGFEILNLLHGILVEKIFIFIFAREPKIVIINYQI